MESSLRPSICYSRTAALEAIYPAPAYLWPVVAITCIGAFIGQIDASIVQLTLRTLERTFHATLATVSWVAIGNVLAYAATLLVFARMAEIFGRKIP
jgi:MFS family permease